MELFDEDIVKNKNKNEKIGTRIILAIIILLVILCVVIVFLIMYLKNSIITVTIDGNENSKIRDMLVFEEDNNNVYIPIRKFANILGYESYNGEYLNPSEDVTKCYVQSEDEVINIALNSNIIEKKELSSNSFLEKIELEESINEIDGELYTNIDGAKKIFNLNFDYNEENKKITIYTLQYLVDYYNSKLPNYGYEKLKEDFKSQKAILNEILIAINSNKNYGVVKTSTGETILEPKYDDIEYLESTNEFLVTSGGKKGIISYDKKIIIDIEYEKIEEINENLYMVTKNSNIGILNKLGKTIIYPKYDYIGIENNQFKESQSQDDYIILDELIPIKEDSKWAIFKIDGTQVTDFVYDDLGCIISGDKEKESILFIEGYDVFITQINKKYYLVTKDGENAIDYGFDSIYKIDNEGKEEYYMTYNNGKTVNVVTWLEKVGISKKD